MAFETAISADTLPRFRLSAAAAKPARRCLCSPTNHPGSFRCHLHRNASSSPSGGNRQAKASASQIQIQWERMSPAAKAKSLKAFLLQVIKPSSHDLQRRRDFQPRPSRFFLRRGSDGVAVS